MIDPLHSHIRRLTINHYVPDNRYDYVRSAMLRATSTRSIELVFDKGAVKILLGDGDEFMLPLCPETTDKYKLNTAYQVAVEQGIRQFLAKTRNTSCYLDCGSIGRCQLCTRTGAAPLPEYRAIRDYYHKSGEPREACPDELDTICLDIWVDQAPRREIGAYLMRCGLRASNQQIHDAWERFFKDRK